MSELTYHAHDAKLQRERDHEQAQNEAWERDEEAQDAAVNALAGWDEWADPNG